MNIHELYAQKQRAYQDYLVEQRVYEQNVNAAVDELKQAVDNLLKMQDMTDLGIASQLKTLLSVFKTDDDFKDRQKLNSVADELAKLQFAIEHT